MSWATVGVLAGLIAGLGYALDRWSLHRQKHVVYDRLIAWWVRLDETPVPDLPRRMAEWSLRVWHKVIGPKFFSARALRASLGASLILTTLAIFGGFAIEHGEVFVAVWGFLTAAYAVNAIFDAATILVTYHAIRIVRDRGGKIAALAMFGDVALAYAFAVACGVTLLVGTGDYSRPALDTAVEAVERGVTPWLETPPPEYLRPRDRIHLIDGEPHVILGPLPLRLFVCTTLLPTCAWAGFLLFLTFAKLVLAGAKRVGLFVLERATEDDVPTFQPFTLLGSMFAAIAFVAKTVQHFVG